MNRASSKQHFGILKYVYIIWLFFICISFADAQSFANVDSLKNIINSKNHDTVKVAALINLSGIYKSSDLDSSMYFAGEARRIANEIGFYKGSAEAFFALGDAEVSRDSIDQAITYYLSSIDQYFLTNSETKLTNLYLILGSLYTYQQNLFEALDCFQKALKIAERIDSKEIQVKVYNNLDSVYQHLEKYEEALECYNSALVNLNYSGPKALFFANLFSGMGSAHYYLKNYDEAIINLQKGFDKAEETGQLSIVADCADKLSHVYEIRGEYETSPTIWIIKTKNSPPM